MLNHIKTMFLMVLLTVILLVAGEFLLGEGGTIIALVLAIALNFFAYWYSDEMESNARRRPVQVNEAASHMFIVNPLSARGLSKLFSTDPPIEERVKRFCSLHVA
ncbi:MAG: hypothetical protein R6U91_07125 [Bacillota bacterium]